MQWRTDSLSMVGIIVLNVLSFLTDADDVVDYGDGSSDVDDDSNRDEGVEDDDGSDEGDMAVDDDDF